MRRARRYIWALPITSVIVVSGMLVSGPAYAANYDGTDPGSTGCAGPYANTEYALSVPGGTLELRFSTLCLTAWARFTCQISGGCTNYRLFVHRNTDGKEEGVRVSQTVENG